MKFTLFALFASASLAHAATVTWDVNPTALTGNTDQIITGVTSAVYNLDTIDQPDIFTGTTTGSSVSGVSSADYASFLDTFAFGSTGFQLNGLQAGANYNVQLFYVDDRTPANAGRIQNIDDTNGNVASLTNGSFSTGTFTADASGLQQFTLSGDGGGSHFNILVLTSNDATLSTPPTSNFGTLAASAVPEPTSAALLGLGGLLLLGRRKRA